MYQWVTDSCSFCSREMVLFASSIIAGSSSRSWLPAEKECYSVSVKAVPAQCLSSSDQQSPSPFAPIVLKLDSLQPFPDL